MADCQVPARQHDTSAGEAVKHPRPIRIAFYGKTQTAGSWWLDMARLDFTRRVREDHEARMLANKESRQVIPMDLATMQAPLPGTGKKKMLPDLGPLVQEGI